MKLFRPLCLTTVALCGFLSWVVLPGPDWVGESSPLGDTQLGDWIFAVLGPALPCVLVGVLAAWGSGGWSSVRAAALFLTGEAREGELLHAHNGLAAAARGTLASGLVLGLFYCAGAFLVVIEGLEQGGANPADLAERVSGSILVPAMALAAGRLVLGTAADAAAVEAGVPSRRTFGRGSDLGLILFAIPPLLSFTPVFTSFS